jgi:hypothetical protein
MSAAVSTSPISSETAVGAILDLLDQHGPDLLFSLKAAAKLLDDIDDYKGQEAYGIELAGLGSWALHPAREFAEKLEAAFLAWANSNDDKAPATD